MHRAAAGSRYALSSRLRQLSTILKEEVFLVCLCSLLDHDYDQYMFFFGNKCRFLYECPSTIELCQLRKTLCRCGYLVFVGFKLVLR